MILEEKEKQKIVNTKEFSNYLNNKEYFNDRVLNDINHKDNKEEEKKKLDKIIYLKKLAFKDIKEKSQKNFFSEGANLNTESDEEQKNKNFKKNVNFETENQLKIGGKVYRMQNQMGEIARQILNKCKFYSQKKI